MLATIGGIWISVLPRPLSVQKLHAADEATRNQIIAELRRYALECATNAQQSTKVRRSARRFLISY
jgi:hypothetical protein